MTTPTPTPPALHIPEPTPFADLLALRGKTAIVTGGSRGIGEAAVLRLSQAGAAVVVTGRNKEAVAKTVARVEATGGKALGIPSDVSNLEDSRNVIAQTVSKFGTVDILVNNAALFPPSFITEISEKIWDETVNTDLKGAFFLAQFAVQEMLKKSHGGRIINVLSTEMLRPTGFLTAYGAAKAGLLAATQAMAKELGKHGILVNAVIPGSTITAERIQAMKEGRAPTTDGSTPSGAVATQQMLQERVQSGGLAQMLQMLPMGRPGFPDELAKAILFLASDLSSYVNGTSLLVDGAQTLR